jgi:hypothetical protein
MTARIWVLAAAIAGFACGGAEQAPSTDAAQAPSPAAEAVAEPAVDDAALGLVRAAIGLLQSQPSFSVTIESSHDALQPSGEKLEFGVTRRVLLRRPDRLRVEAEPREGGLRVVQFDGTDLTVLDKEANAYARVGRKGDLDGAVDFLRNDLSIDLPLAELFRNNPSDLLESGVEAAYLVGEETIGGVQLAHVFVRKPAVDAQLWIARGEQPVLARAVLTYREPDAPQFRATLSDWQFGVEAPDAAFAFQAPAGAEQILFAVEPLAEQTEEAAQ